MHIKLTSRFIRRHLNRRTYFYTGNKREIVHKKKKKDHPGFEPRTPRSEVQQTCLFTYSGSCMTVYQIDMYLYVRIDVSEKLEKKRKEHPPQGDDASTVSAATCRVGRGEQGGTSSNQRTERWTSSRCRTFTAQNLG